MDILNYCSLQEQSFSQLPITVLDIALLTEVNYLVFKNILSNQFSIEEGLSLEKVASAYKNDTTPKTNELVIAYQSRIKILEKLAVNPRFKDIVAFAHQDYFDEKEEVQFASTTFLVDNQLLTVFRGTDSSLIGWKEDFNLSFQDEIPAQSMAVAYVKQLSEKYHYPMILSGHSKGGNLALYAATKFPQASNLQSIYAFDAPGLQEDLVRSSEFKKIAPKINSYRPQSSIVGVLFNQGVDTQVVESTGIGALQHLMFLWQVNLETPSFISARKISRSSYKVEEFIGNYLKNSHSKDNQQTVDVLFQATKSVFQSNLTIKQKVGVFVKTLLYASKEDRKAIRKSVVNLFTSFYSRDTSDKLQPTEKFRSRYLFLRFLHLPQQISLRSKWLASGVFLILAYSCWILNRYPRVNFLAFSYLYLLALFLSWIFTFRSWWSRKDWFSIDYLPGMYSIVTLLYSITHFTNMSLTLTRSIIYLIFIWAGQFAYQAYQIRQHLPEFARPLKRLAIYSFVLASFSYIFPAFLEIVINKSIVLILVYQACVAGSIAWKLWRN
ncbi:TPA: DUF2974 domain-containing protein [Streptococcus suis]|nr:DUF2974 domain-containing protein [Streptococcus suis]